MKARRIAAATMLSMYLASTGVLAIEGTNYASKAAKHYVTSADSLNYNSFISDAQMWNGGVIEAKDLRTYYDIALSEEEQDIIRDIASEYELDFELVLSVCYIESKYNVNANSGSSVGIMQVQPTWWNETFAELGGTNWYSLEDNVRMGCYIIHSYYETYGQTSRVLSAYNTGNPNANNGYANKVLEFQDELKEKKYAKYYSG